MIAEQCEKCPKKISDKMARASESHYGGQALCIDCQIKETEKMVKEGKYPEKLAKMRIAQLRKYQVKSLKEKR